MGVKKNMISVVYRLTRDGQRRAILSGKDAQLYQVVQVNPPDIPASFMKHIYVDFHGNGYLSFVRDSGPESIGIPRGALLNALERVYNHETLHPEYIDFDEPVSNMSEFLQRHANELPMKLAEARRAKEEYDAKLASEREDIQKKFNEQRDSVAQKFLLDSSARVPEKSIFNDVVYLRDERDNSVYEFKEGHPVFIEALKRQKIDILQKEQHEKKRKRSILKFLKSHATDNQYKRYHAGLLPECELIEIIRSTFFAVTDKNFKRYFRLTSKHITHKDDCICNSFIYDKPECFKFEIRRSENLTSKQWEHLNRIKDLLHNNKIDVYYREHSVSCKICGENAVNVGVLCSLDILGFTIYSEYQGYIDRR